MDLEAGHFESPGALARLKNSGAAMLGDDWHRATPVRTEDAWPSPSRVGEDEVARDEVMRSGVVDASRSHGLRGKRLSRRMQRGLGSLR